MDLLSPKLVMRGAHAHSVSLTWPMFTLALELPVGIVALHQMEKAQ